ncbi:recombinase family protein [Candidatus Woesebacteria bacterium]|nr:recombinase family protein [Candidatus Woesebacteria bacterium]
MVKAMFERVAKFGHSGRTIRNWLKEIGFKTRNGKLPALSRIYSTLNNPFYYGEFQYGDEWYKGKHEPLVSKEIWEKVQKQLTVPPKKWHKNKFPFKTLCICGSCGGGVTAEERYKKLKYGGFNKHIYYHCGRSVDYDCDEPYITEEDLIKQLLAHINAGNVSINKGKIAKKLKADIERFHKLRSEVLRQEYLSGNLGEIENSAVKTNDDEMAIDYLKHILKTGSSDDRREALGMIRAKFILRNKELKVA